jgi:hypothetical protein
MAHNETLSVSSAQQAIQPGSHRYVTVSAHRTSEGLVSYQRCACGRWRISRRQVTKVPGMC